MQRYSGLLNQSIRSMIDVKEEKGLRQPVQRW